MQASASATSSQVLAGWPLSWHAVLMLLCLAIFVGVSAVLLYAILAHRRVAAGGGNYHKSAVVEVIWAVVPFLIIIGLALPATRSVVEQDLHCAATRGDAAAVPVAASAALAACR